MGSLSKALTIFKKDVLSEIRTKDILGSVLVFALLIVVILNFAFESGTESFKLVAPGVLWITFTFAGMLNISRSFVQEKESGCLEGLTLCPVGRESIYLGKMLGCLAFMLMVEVVILPIFSILFNLSLFMPMLIVVVFLGTLGFATVGTIFSALSVHTKARDVMLPLIFFPIVVPVLIAAVKASSLIFSGATWGELGSWLAILGAFDIVFLVAAAWVFENVIEQ